VPVAEAAPAPAGRRVETFGPVVPLAAAAPLAAGTGVASGPLGARTAVPLAGPPVPPVVPLTAVAAVVPAAAAAGLVVVAAPTARGGPSVRPGGPVVVVVASGVIIVCLVHRWLRGLRCRRVGRGRGREVRPGCAAAAAPGSSWWCGTAPLPTPGP